MSGFVGLLDSTGAAVTVSNPLSVQVGDTNGGITLGSYGGQDATNATLRGALTWVGNDLFNGTSWDRQRGNVDTGALITHTAASAGTNSGDQTNFNGRGLKLVIDVTALTGTTPTLTVTIQGKDPVSGKYYTILVSAALAAVATTVLTVYPGLTAAANLTAVDILPRTFRILTAIGGTTPAVTATIGASVIV